MLQSHGHFTKTQALGGNVTCQFSVLGWIHYINPAGLNCDSIGVDAAKCVAASTPSARPHTITYPAGPSSAGSDFAIRVPSEDALRAPTIDKTGRCKSDR